MAEQQPPPDGAPHVLRVGITTPSLGAMDKESDRGAIADHDFYDIQNARRRGGRWFSRGGQAKVNTIALPAPALGMFDLTNTGPYAGAVGTCGSGGPSIYPGLSGTLMYDGQNNTVCDLVLPGTSFLRTAVSPGGNLQNLAWNGTVGVLTLANLARGPYPLNAGGGSIVPYSYLGSFPGQFPGMPAGATLENMTGLGYFQGNIFLGGISDNAAGSVTFASIVFNGEEFLLEFTQTGITWINPGNSEYNACNYRETLMWLPRTNAGYTADFHTNIFIRDAAGNYTEPVLTSNNTNSTLIPASGRVDNVSNLTINCTAIMPVNGVDTLFLGGWAYCVQSGTNYGPRGVILTWDGTTLKVVRVIETSPATCTPDPTQLPGLVLFGITQFYYNQAANPGSLFYFYTNSYPSSGCGGVSRYVSRMGLFNGSYTDTLENFVTDPTFTGLIFAKIGVVKPYRGRLFLIGTDLTGNVTAQTVMASTDLGVSGTWTVEHKFSNSVITPDAFGPFSVVF